MCCDSACDGPCEGCTTGIDGTCAPAGAGTDPDDDCPAEDPSTCGSTGLCDGARACTRHPAGTVCAPPSCAGGVQTLPRTCNASGTCGAAGTTTCASGCDGPVCAGSCSMDSMCGAGTFCEVATGNCVALLPDGAPSIVPTHCASGIVADGVCCMSACDGVCESCLGAATGGSDGRCRPSSAGTDPDGECALSAPATCDTNGECDGTGACAIYASGDQCAPPSCTGGVETRADTCDGAGTCDDQGTAPCGAYACGATACRTSCSIDGDCAAGNYCSLGSTCLPQHGNGVACSRGGECTSGNCVDGVCCNTACVGACIACSRADRGGVGTDGTCGPVAAGMDPASECAATAMSTCGTTGACDGAAACARHPSGTVCLMASCAGGTLDAADTCDGAGTCVDGGVSSCGPYACAASGTACRTSCTTDAHCAFGSNCDVGMGICRTPLTNGEPCTSGTECGSTFCVDGVCCDAICTGTCSACTAALKGSGVDGSCGPITSGTDPEMECPDDGVTSCDRTGTCSGAGACSLYSAGTPCSTASCASGSVSPADLCNGSGTCVDSGTMSCAPFLCAAGACTSTCASDAECATSAFCDVPMNRCRPDQANGATCTSGTQCTSGNCVEGYCCGSTCTGNCMSCAVSGMLGSCVNVPSGTSDPGTCNAPMVCNGSGVCFRSNGMTCSGDSQCLSNECTDGYCCNVACTSNCMACDISGALGACTNIPNGTDPDNDCGGSWVCNGSGGCRSP